KDRVLLPSDPSHPDCREFSDWNSQQETPLDTSKVVFPDGHRWFSDVAQLTDYCKKNGILLFNAARRDHPGVFAAVGSGDFPGIGYLQRLQVAVGAYELGPPPLIGSGPEKSKIWVTQD